MFSASSSVRGVQVLRSFLGPGGLNSVSRNYVRRITPLSIIPRKAPRPEQFADNQHIDPELYEKIQGLDDTDMEPSMEEFGKAYQVHEREQEENFKKMGRLRMVQRHFKPFIEKEICVLTYAEKEKIRFLHKSDPEEWSVEALSQAFPISEIGVSKLIRSSFRCRYPEDIVKHDNLIAEKLEDIRTGKIKLTPDLKEKMAMRNAMPLNLGATSIPEIGALIPAPKPKKLGPFARIVAKPGAEPPEPEAPELLRLRRGIVDKNVPPPPQLPPLENYDSRLVLDANDRPLSLNLDSNERMTMADFESQLKSIDAKSAEDIDEEDTKQIKYLLNHKRRLPDPERNRIDEREFSESVARPPTIHEYVDFNQVVKFKRNLEEPPKVEITVDRGRSYIYDSEHGYQKPFGSEADHIRIPANAQKEGSVYRVGNAYYDENGSFLYRVI